MIGDVNQGNVWVHKTKATALLIDCDSFQFSLQGNQFLCEVGVGHFTPPELQQITSFASTPRTVDHDHFGLAVLVFHLLFFGRHPYAGRQATSKDLTLEEAISRNLFAYGSAAERLGITRPPGAMPLDYLGGDVAVMFEVAFGSDRRKPRPSANDWLRALDRVESELARCTAEGAHVFPKALPKCPWCDIEDRQGLALFVSRNVSRLYDRSHFSLGVLWAQVEAISLGSVSCPFDPSKIPVDPSPYPGWRRLIAHAWRVVAVAGAGILTAIEPSLFWIWGGAGYMLWTADPPVDPEVRRRTEARDRAAERFAQLKEEWEQPAATRRFSAVRAELDSLRKRHLELPRKYADRVSAMRAQARSNQLHRFLERFPIASAKIDGIGQSRKDTLVSFGIVSAADATQSNLRAVPGIGRVMAGRITKWRSGIESRFVFDPNRADDPQEIARINRQIDQERSHLEQQLVQRLGELQLLAKRVDAERQAARGRLYSAAQSLAQATVDVGAT